MAIDNIKVQRSLLKYSIGFALSVIFLLLMHENSLPIIKFIGFRFAKKFQYLMILIGTYSFIKLFLYLLVKNGNMTYDDARSIDPLSDYRHEVLEIKESFLSWILRIFLSVLVVTAVFICLLVVICIIGRLII